MWQDRKVEIIMVNTVRIWILKKEKEKWDKSNIYQDKANQLSKLMKDTILQT